MDQKANSVADIAAVLKQRENAPTPVQNAIGKRKAKKSVDAQASTEAQETTTAEGVRIRWTNVLDAQFAENWPSSVVHGALRKDRYAAAPPPARRIIGKPSAEVLEADTPKAYTQL